MQTSITTLDHSVLRRIRSLALFNNGQLDNLAAKLEISTAAPKQRIIALGDTGNYGLYLLGGESISRDGDGNQCVVQFETDGNLQPVAHIRPSLYDIETLSPVEYLEIPNDLLTELSLLEETVVSLPLTVRTSNKVSVFDNGFFAVITFCFVGVAIWAELYWAAALIGLVMALLAPKYFRNARTKHDAIHVIDKRFVQVTILPSPSDIENGITDSAQLEEPTKNYSAIVTSSGETVTRPDFYSTVLEHPDKEMSIKFDDFYSRKVRDRFASDLALKLNLPVRQDW